MERSIAAVLKPRGSGECGTVHRRDLPHPLIHFPRASLGELFKTQTCFQNTPLIHILQWFPIAHRKNQNPYHGLCMVWPYLFLVLPVPFFFNLWPPAKLALFCFLKKPWRLCTMWWFTLLGMLNPPSPPSHLDNSCLFSYQFKHHFLGEDFPILQTGSGSSKKLTSVCNCILL